MRKPKTLTPTPDRSNAHLEERAAAVRKGKGKLLSPKTATPEQATPAPEPAQPAPPARTMRAPADAHPDAYGLRVDDGGLGLHAPPGSGILVEPVMPTKAGLAVFYFKGASSPTIFDLTHHFRPEFATPCAPGSEVMPLIEVVAPITGAFQRIDASHVEKIHRVTGIYVPISGAGGHPRRPEPLPLLSECREGMGEQYVRESVAYPLVRPGETVVYDPSLREPTHGALCVLQWNNGSRSILLTNFRQSGGEGEKRWWTDPVNRPGSREALERRLAQNLPGDVLHASDGPYEIDHLREKIVGTVVGVLVPERKTSVLRSIAPALPAPASTPHEIDEAEGAPADEADGEPEATEDSDDTELLRLGREFMTAQDRALAERIAARPAHAAAGLRVKLRALCHYDPASMRTALPENPDLDQRLYFSLRQDVERETEADTEEPVTVETALRSPQDWTGKFAAHAIGMHVADKTLRMSKPELVAFITGAADRANGADEAIYKAIIFAQEAAEGWGKFLHLAATRYLIAASAMTVEREIRQAESGEA